MTLRPSLTEQMRLWWDLVQPDGYGYAVGSKSWSDQLCGHFGDCRLSGEASGVSSRAFGSTGECLLSGVALGAA